MHSELVEYAGSHGIHQGYLSFPDHDRPAPCILLVHDWSGPSGTTCEAADAIAALGYVGFAVDLYGKGRRGRNAEESAALMQPFVDRRDLIVEGASHAIRFASAQPRIDATRMAAVGFCFGGMCVLDLARRGVGMAGVVSVHGVLAPIPDQPPMRMDTKVLVLQGSADPLAPPASLEALGIELSSAHADWQCHVFGQALHAFTNPSANDTAGGNRYDPRAHARTRRLVADFLGELFPPSVNSAGNRG